MGGDFTPEDPGSTWYCVMSISRIWVNALGPEWATEFCTCLSEKVLYPLIYSYDPDALKNWVQNYVECTWVFPIVWSNDYTDKEHISV